MLQPRWLAVGMFALFTALNYLDRQTLAALAPQLKTEFRLSNEDYGWLQSAFNFVYAFVAPLAGLLIDRLGLHRGAILSILAWSAAAAATGWVDSYTGLLACRMLLGAAEAGGIPAFGKAAASYLAPKERALGTGVNSLGVSLGSLGAPLLAGSVAAVYGWRAAFVAGGVLGLFWIPLWLLVQRRAPLPRLPAGRPVATPFEMLRDVRLWALIGGNALAMTTYGLWVTWTTIFLVKRYGLTQTEANLHYAWIPPVVAAFGGVLGGWIALRLIGGGATVMAARSRVILWGSLAVLITLAVPLMPTPALATAMVSLSFFFTMAVSANVYALPQDLFGPERTAFAVSAITSGYGLMLTFYNPLIGRLVDQYGFYLACVLSAALPLCGWLLLHRTTFQREAR